MKTTSLFRSLLISSLFLFSVYSCTQNQPTDLTKSAIIPKPSYITAGGEAFHLTKKATVVIPVGDTLVAGIGDYLSELLQPSTGYVLPVVTADQEVKKGSIQLILSGTDTDNSNESYTLEITKKGVTITGVSPAGIFRGVQTLRQILPANIEMDTQQPGPWIIPTGTITDQPDYGYRGVMLDVARHFFSVEEVERYIDLVALYKINTLHLHLSDDQGWRIEITSWPKLTEIGGQTEVGGGKGGYYTQQQYRGIVAYAQKRFITVIPEIDMPGHTNAALASYAALNCDNKARELYTGTDVGFSTLCTDKEIVYRFIDNVIGELAAMTPGPYIHIGGDESHSTPMEDYIPFEERVQNIVKNHGKKVIGWDEIANSKLLPNTIVQFWARSDNALKGVEQGARVLMSPANHTYLDMKYDSTTTLGLHWAGYINVDTAYMWDPAHLVPGIGKEDIVGIEAPIWTETITNIREVEYMAFPRIIALSEVGWTPNDLRNWDDFRTRLAAQKARLDALGVNYYPSPSVDW